MKKKLLAVLLAIVMMCSLATSAYATNTIDLDRKGSIKVKVIDDGTPLRDLKLTCIRVAKLEVINGNYEYVRIYDGKKLSGEIYSEGLAKQLYTFVTDNTSNYTFSKLDERVDDDGFAIFTNRTPGLYLIIQEDDYSLNGKKYDKLSPFIVSIPYNGEYNVDASSKPTLDVLPTDPPPATEPPAKLPQTGQLNWPIPVLAVSGIALFLFGWILCSNSRKDTYEE